MKMLNMNGKMFVCLNNFCHTHLICFCNQLKHYSKLPWLWQAATQQRHQAKKRKISKKSSIWIQWFIRLNVLAFFYNISLNQTRDFFLFIQLSLVWKWWCLDGTKSKCRYKLWSSLCNNSSNLLAQCSTVFCYCGALKLLLDPFINTVGPASTPITLLDWWTV